MCNLQVMRFRRYLYFERSTFCLYLDDFTACFVLGFWAFFFEMCSCCGGPLLQPEDHDKRWLLLLQHNTGGTMI